MAGPRSPACGRTFAGLGISLKSMGDVEGAIDAFGKAFEASPEDPNNGYNLAVTLEGKEGGEEEAIKV